VVDTGVGIPRANLSAVFAPVRHRSPEDPARRPVGLYVSRLIVEAHGGRMWAESDGLSGTTIYFTLPTA
jgi:signal transduction histidine kinase